MFWLNKYCGNKFFVFLIVPEMILFFDGIKEAIAMIFLAWFYISPTISFHIIFF